MPSLSHEQAEALRDFQRTYDRYLSSLVAGTTPGMYARGLADELLRLAPQVEEALAIAGVSIDPAPLEVVPPHGLDRLVLSRENSRLSTAAHDEVARQVRRAVNLALSRAPRSATAAPAAATSHAGRPQVPKPDRPVEGVRANALELGRFLAILGVVAGVLLAAVDDASVAPATVSMALAVSLVIEVVFARRRWRPISPAVALTLAAVCVVGGVVAYAVLGSDDEESGASAPSTGTDTTSVGPTVPTEPKTPPKQPSKQPRPKPKPKTRVQGREIHYEESGNFSNDVTVILSDTSDDGDEILRVVLLVGRLRCVFRNVETPGGAVTARTRTREFEAVVTDDLVYAAYVRLTARPKRLRAGARHCVRSAAAQ